MVFHYSLNDRMSPQVSRTFLSILANLNKAVVWMVSIHSLISSSSSYAFPSHWGLFQVHQLQLVLLSPSCSTGFLVLWQGPSTCLSFCFLWFSLSTRTEKSSIQQVLFFLLIITRFGLLATIRWSVCISKSQRILCISFSWTDSILYGYLTSRTAQVFTLFWLDFCYRVWF